MFEAPAAPPKAAPQQQAGEFTRMFEVPQQAQPAPPPPPGQAGEFTRMFNAPAAAPPQPPPRGNEPGEFTRYFESPMTPQPLPSTPAQPYGQPKPAHDPFGAPAKPDLFSKPAAPASGGPGEFTRIFGKADMPGSMPPQTAQPPAGGISATQSFSVGGTPPAGARPGGGAAGDYTRMFESPAQQPQAAPAAPAAAPPQNAPAPAARPAQSNVIAYVLIGVFVLLALALVLFLFLRR
jgi:hypothetical protein